MWSSAGAQIVGEVDVPVDCGRRAFRCERPAYTAEVQLELSSDREQVLVSELRRAAKQLVVRLPKSEIALLRARFLGEAGGRQRSLVERQRLVLEHEAHVGGVAPHQ